MKLARLYQPSKPAFWLMVVLNLLSTVLAWIARSHDLLPWVAVVIAVFAVVNAVVGLRLALGLMREAPVEAMTGNR
ncbi:hypothetical protein [Parazoarcus communis]|uniref:Uncharacterized protein n=1 Tax=Parazoarcus communis SWub3 = DSM 12120 TaxID=1121029 RepID=A0A323V4V4_9RHOO|nr:hypothetical protein [Parazoarcus communis]NMG69233.1 hypothetical protein [Parazoarcus communis SWub3 = DSM 12120]PZA18476.1 hypothetical protein DNK49_02825 [Azoarcus communis] [Parazoarcus communis SWub3 = DSM 12120]